MGKDTLWQWTKQMADVGFRHTGSRAHRRYIDMVAGQLAGYGLTVKRYPTPLDYWEATSWLLEVTDAEGLRHDIPVAYYRPYSGETPPQGVTAPVVDIGTADVAGYGHEVYIALTALLLNLAVTVVVSVVLHAPLKVPGGAGHTSRADYLGS